MGAGKGMEREVREGRGESHEHEAYKELGEMENYLVVRLVASKLMLLGGRAGLHAISAMPEEMVTERIS